MNNNQNIDWKVNEYEDSASSEPVKKPEPPLGEAIKTMVFGIIAVQCSMIPVLSIIGIIFGSLAKKWAPPIIDNYPYTGARLFAKAGQITGQIGYILGIIFTVFWAIYFLIGIIALFASASIIKDFFFLRFNFYM